MAEKRRSARRRSAGEWQSVLRQLAASGEEVARFCRREGIHEPTLRWWQWRLEGAGRSVERRPAARPSATGNERDFTELRIVAAPARQEGANCFELRWRDGLTLAIPQAFDRDALRQLLAVLEVSGC